MKQYVAPRISVVRLATHILMASGTQNVSVYDEKFDSEETVEDW